MITINRFSRIHNQVIGLETGIMFEDIACNKNITHAWCSSLGPIHAKELKNKFEGRNFDKHVRLFNPVSIKLTFTTHKRPEALR